MKYLVEVVQKKKQWYVRLKFSNGKIFMHSESYRNNPHAMRKARELAKTLKSAVKIVS